MRIRIDSRLLRACAVVAACAAACAAPAAASSGGVATVSEETATASGSLGKYERIWNSTSQRDKRWAHRTAECESGGNPKAVSSNGTYRGAFQFMKDTWRSAPKSPGGDPIDYPYSTQAVVAVALKHREGSSPWPVCG